MTYRHNKNRVMKQCSTRRRIAVVACVVLFSVAVICVMAIGLSGQGGEDCTMTLYVRDDMGRPVSNATAMVYVVSVNRINAGSRSSDWAHYTALTDTNGMAVVQFKCFIDGAYEWGVKAAGYYCPNLKSGSLDCDGEDASPENLALIEEEKAKIAAGTGGSWLRVLQLINPSFTLNEHTATNEVTIVRKRNPQPMWERDSTNSRRLTPLASVDIGNGVISNSYPRVGFDIKNGEYLMPYGDGGEFADFWVEQYSIVSNDVTTHIGYIEFSPGCGVYRAQRDGRELGPVCFGVDTNQVFTNRLNFMEVTRGSETMAERLLAAGNEYLVLHTRVTDNGEGQMSAGNYSMMEGPVWISGGIHFKDLIFNPRPGDTNLEMDTRKNYAMSWTEEWED